MHTAYATTILTLPLVPMGLTLGPVGSILTAERNENTERDFAAHYRVKFPPAGRKSSDDRTVAGKPSESYRARLQCESRECATGKHAY
jgi:hypothetical protein